MEIVHKDVKEILTCALEFPFQSTFNVRINLIVEPLLMLLIAKIVNYVLTFHLNINVRQRSMGVLPLLLLNANKVNIVFILQNKEIAHSKILLDAQAYQRLNAN